MRENCLNRVDGNVRMKGFMNHNKKIFERIISKTKIYLVVIAILLVVLCIYDKVFIIPSIISYLMILAYAYWTNSKGQEELSEHIRNLTFSVDKFAKTALINSPFPIIIAESNETVVFKNTKFIEEFANIDINNYVSEILKNVKIQLNNEKQEKVIDEINIDKKTYRIYGKYMPLKDQTVIAVYFIDVTRIRKLEKEFDDKESYVGLIMIDNYEEITQRIPDEQKTQLIAKIEKSIYDWIAGYDGLVLKSERDLFVCILEKSKLKEIEEKRFEILDSIKEEQSLDKVQFTLSIAMSNDGKNDSEKYKSAQASLDIVLGRGGDQAVIKEEEKYNFFGGRTQEVEKRTKVKARIVSHALEELMKEANNIIIMGHSNPDIDCVGSGIGIYKLAKTLGKEAYIISETYGLSLDSFIETIQKEPEYKNVVIGKSEAISKITEDTLLVIVDTHKTNYVEVPELLEKTDKIVIIDHHRRSTDYIENATLTFQEVYASSASELVTEIIEYANTEIKLTELEAEALYAGIMMDTKAFTFKTGVRTFEAAAYLRKCGVDIIKVKKWFQSDLGTYNKISTIVGKSEVIYDSIAISIYEEEDKNANIVCAKAADELLTISNITASFVIGKLGNKVCISGRSIGDINVQIILEKLGGGGHITLAGAQVEGMEIDEVKQELINRIHEYFSEIVN